MAKFPFSILYSLRKYFPKRLRRWGNRNVYISGFDVYVKAEDDPYRTDPPIHEYPESRYCVGIVTEFFHHHKNYIAACREVRQSYKLIDISGPDWVKVVRESECDAYLVWPSAARAWKEMFDERLKVMEEELAKLVYPTYREIWFYENKRRAFDWLTANDIPHPRTWVFYDYDRAIEFINNAEFPLVHKTNFGAAARGVTVLRQKTQAKKLVERAFTKGIVPPGNNPLDRQWGSVLLQEFLPNVREWRTIRMGDSYFGYRKVQRGDFHSGTQLKAWEDPPKDLLNLVRHLTERGGFTSMNADVFETRDGQFLVNELHPVFGQSTPEAMRVGGKPGRYLFQPDRGEWLFEEGDFTRNSCANLRLAYLRDNLLASRLE